MSRAHVGWALGSLLVASGYYVLYSQQGIFVTVAGIDITPINLGEIGAVCLLFTIAYAGRKRLGIGAFGWLDSWLWAHIYLGLLGAYFIWFHSRQRFTPSALLPNAAMILLIFTAISGIVGRVLYRVIPRLLGRLPDYDPPDAIQVRISALEREAEALVALKSHPFQTLAAQLATGALELTPAAPGWAQYQQARASLPPGEVRDLDRVAELTGQSHQLRQTLGRRRRFRRILELWWTVHVRLTETGLILGALHILDAIFSGRLG